MFRWDCVTYEIILEDKCDEQKSEAGSRPGWEFWGLFSGVGCVLRGWRSSRSCQGACLPCEFTDGGLRFCACVWWAGEPRARRSAFPACPPSNLERAENKQEVQCKHDASAGETGSWATGRQGVLGAPDKASGRLHHPYCLPLWLLKRGQVLVWR